MRPPLSPPRIAAIGFSVQSPDGSVAGLEPALRAHAALGTEAIEIAASSLDLVAAGRVLARPLAELAALTRAYPFTYTVHGLVASNFMDPETRERQLAAALAMVEVCGAIGARILVQHSGFVRADRAGTGPGPRRGSSKPWRRSARPPSAAASASRSRTSSPWRRASSAAPRPRSRARSAP